MVELWPQIQESVHEDNLWELYSLFLSWKLERIWQAVVLKWSIIGRGKHTAGTWEESENIRIVKDVQDIYLTLPPKIPQCLSNFGLSINNIQVDLWSWQNFLWEVVMGGQKELSRRLKSPCRQSMVGWKMSKGWKVRPSCECSTSWMKAEAATRF